jgi:4-hydroxybutyrate CoA-transferase
MTGNLQTADHALGQVPPGSRVLATPSCATPTTLLSALGVASAAIPKLSLMGGLMLGEQSFLDSVEAGTLAYRTWHVAPEQRKLVRRGLVDYIPMRAIDIPMWLPGCFEVLLVRVSPPDERGWCSLGPSASWTRVALDAATMVIAEVDPDFPVTFGDTGVHVDEIDHLVDSATATPQYRSAATTQISDAIARHVLGLLPIDPCVQLGIGAVPETVAASLGEADLGQIRIVGMGCDAMVDLIDRSPTGRRPVLQSVELMGTEVLMSAAHRNPRIEMIPSTQCHDPRWLASLDRLVSVNSAVEIDLGGQVASETIGGNVIAGIGGSFDFFEGAHLAAGGRRVVALQSTTPDGSISKIVPSLATGTPVTLPRHTVDFVVTEHGIARLAGRSLRERAEALIQVAAPAFRDELAESLG